MLKGKRVVAIVPAYNEEKHISQVVELTKKYVDLVVVVDDGSSDKTVDVARGAGADVVLSHAMNAGKGVGLYTGFLYAEKIGADVVVTLDADMQHDPARIPDFVDKIVNEGMDIVVGARRKSSRMPFVYRFGNYVLNTTFVLLFGEKISDTQSGYRAFGKGVFSKIAWRSSGYVVETEMLARACAKRLKIGELTIANTYHNKYKGTTIFDGIRIFIKMLSWRIF